MRIIVAFVLISCFYLITLYLIFRHFGKKSKNEGSQLLSEIREEINIIAIPRNYIINVVQDDRTVDTTQYADMVVNISDLIRTKSTNGDQVEQTIIKVFLKDINFSIYKSI